MKKNQVLITLLLLGIFVGSLYFLGILKYMMTGLQGYTTLSLSQAGFKTDDPNDPWWNSKVYILTVVQGGMSQSARGTITKQEVDDKGSTEKPLNDLTIDITYGKQTCEYPIRVNSNVPNVNRYSYHSFTKPLCLDWKKCVREYCLEHYPNSKWVGAITWTLTAFCIEEKPQTGAVAYTTIENPTVHTISTTSVKAKGETYTSNLDTQQATTQQIGPYVFAIWDGYLNKGTCDSQSSYYGFYSQGSWKIGHATNYETYKTQYDTQITKIKLYETNGWSMSEVDLKTAVSLVDTAAVSAIQETSFGTIDKVNNMTDAVIIQDVKSWVSDPVFTYYVKADWLGIYQPVTKPEIVEVSSQKFQSSSEGTIYVKFRNAGDYRGTMQVWATCESPFRQVGPTQEYTLEAGDIETAYIKISMDTNVSVTKYCTVHVKSLAIEVTKKVEVTGDPWQICTSDKYSCIDNKVQKCNSAGSGYETITTCEVGKICEYDTTGKAYCKSKECSMDSDCDDKNAYTTDKCNKPLIGKPSCQNTWICQAEGENCISEQCCPELTCDLSKKICIKSSNDLCSMLPFLCGENNYLIYVGAGIAFIVFVYVARKRFKK